MAVAKGRVLAKELFIEVEGRRHYVPKGCDPVIGPQLEAMAGMDVEVLMAKDTVLAIRLPERVPHIKWPIITCYLIPPEVVFDPEIFMRVEPLITDILLESGYLSQTVVGQLNEFKAFG
jgi:hypothetical protein